MAINALGGMGILTDDDSLVDAALSEILALPVEERHQRDPRRDVDYLLIQHHLAQVSRQGLSLARAHPARITPLTFPTLSAGRRGPGHRGRAEERASRARTTGSQAATCGPGPPGRQPDLGAGNPRRRRGEHDWLQRAAASVGHKGRCHSCRARRRRKFRGRARAKGRDAHAVGAGQLAGTRLLSVRCVLMWLPTRVGASHTGRNCIAYCTPFLYSIHTAHYAYLDLNSGAAHRSRRG